MILTHLVQRRSRSGLGSEFLLAADAGLGFGLINVFMKLTTWDAAERLGSFHVLGSASWAHMVTHPPFWFMVAAIFPAFLFLQAAFAHGRVAVVMPLHIVFINILTIVCAVLVYRESLDLLRSAGILAAIAGAAVLAVQSGTGQDRPGRNLSSRKANGDKNS